jgi:hypothetical protein
LERVVFFNIVKVRDVFDFTSELQCSINLITLEELLFDELKGSKMLDGINLTPEYIRWNQIKEMNFFTFANDKKFEAENELIIRHVKRMVCLKTQRKAKGSFYVYNRNYSVTTAIYSNEDDEYRTSNEIEEDTACLVIPPMEYVFEEKEPVRPNPNKSFASQQDDKSNNSENVKSDNAEEDISSKKFHKSFLGSCHITNNLKESLNYNEEEELKKASLDTSLLPERKVIKLNSEKKLIYDRSELTLEDELNIIKKQSYFKVIDKHLPVEVRKRSKNHCVLCKDIKIVLKENKFSDYVDHYSFLKINRNALEKIPILQFRNLKIESSDHNAVLLNFNNIDDKPITINNRKIMWFIVILCSLFIVAILFIFLGT